MVEEIKTEENFVELIENCCKNEKYLLIDFYAPWCGPCILLNKHLEKIETQYDNIKFSKINIDDDDIFSIVEKYEIIKLPTVIILDGLTIVSKMEQPKDTVLGETLQKL